MADKKLTEADRLKLVDHIVENSSVWSENDRNTLNAFDDVKLYKLAVQEQQLLDNADPTEGEDSDEGGESDTTENAMPPALAAALAKKKGKKAPVDEEEDEEEEEVENRQRPMSEAEWLAMAPKSIRSVVQNAQRKEATEKAELIANMVDHLDDERRPAVAKILNTKSLDELQLLSSLTGKPVETETVANYRGQATPFTINRSKIVEKNEILPIPTINWKEDSKAV